MSTVKNFNVGGVDYPVQDTKATPFLSSADEATLLSNGTYRGDTVANNTIFVGSDGVLKKFTKTVVDKTWQTGTAQTRLGRTNISIHNQVSAQNGDKIVTSLYYGDARRSVDRGVTWTSAGSSSYNASSTSCTVYVQKTGKFYCGTSVGLLATDGTTAFSRVGSSTSSVTTYATDGNVLCCFGGCYTFDNEGTPTWTAANYSITPARYDSVSGVFYGQRQSTNGYYESTDGYTWTLIGSPGQYFNWVAKHGNVVVGFRRNGASNTKRYVSTDGGVNWSSEVFADQEWFGGVYQGLFYMGRTGAVSDFMVSTNGVNWTQMNRPDTASAQALVMVDDKVYMGNYAYYFTTGIEYEYALTPLSYTASEVDTALGGKQNTLTAGTGISISEAIVRDYTVVGTHVSVTDEGIASGFYATSNFSGNSYIKSPSTLPSYSTLYFEIEFTMPSTLFSTDEPLIIMENNISDLFISGQNSVIATWDGSHWNGGSTLLSAGQTYKLRGTETGGTLVIEMLVNGSWVEQIRTSYTPFKNGYNISLGTMYSYYPYFEGSINLSKTFIRVNGADWWRPFVIQPSVISTTDRVTYEAGEGIDITNRTAGQENFTKLGSPTITNKVVSNISEVNQLTIPALTDGPCSTFEVTSVITRTASVDYECCFSSEGNVQLFKYTSGTSFGSWVRGVSDQVTSGRNSVNTTYWVKAVLSASNYKCYCYPYTEGYEPPASLSSWNLCCTITDSSALAYLRNTFSGLTYITGNADPRYAAQYWHGLMNLNYTSVYIDGKLRWTPYTTDANVISNTGDYLVGTTAPTTATAGSIGQRYLNKTDTSSYVLTDYTAGQKNYTTSGTVAVNDYGVARFASSGQVIPNQTWSYSGSPWAVEMKITTPQSTGSGNGVCLFRWGTTDCMIFYNNAGRIVACGWSTGHNPYVEVSAGATYWIKVEYDGTNINLYVSTTSTFPTTPSASSSSPAYWPGNNIATCIGSKNGSETYTGSIDLSSLKWYSNGVLVYSALTDAQYTWKKLQNEIEVVASLPATPTAGTVYFVTGS